MSEKQRYDKNVMPFRGRLEHKPDLSITETYSRLYKLADTDSIINNTARNISGLTFNLYENEGKGWWSFVNIRDELFVVIDDFSYLDARYERIHGDEFIDIHIKLSGNLIISTVDTGHIEVEGPSLLVWNQPKGSELEASSSSIAEEKSITIFCRPSYIKNISLPEMNEDTSELLKIIGTQCEQVAYCNLPVNTDIIETGMAIINAKERFHPIPWLTYIEAKTLELLCIILQSFEKLKETADVTYKDADIAKFYAARDILSRQFNPPPTIPFLAKEVGINVTKLKYGFKALFGITLFQYGHRCRMQFAMELLQKNMHVNLVSEEVGYKHHTTFTTAFKDYFGFRPKDVRNIS